MLTMHISFCCFLKNKTSIIAKVFIKFFLLVRRKYSKLFQRRRNEKF